MLARDLATICARVVEAIAGLILALIVVTSLAEVLFRYVLHNSLVWAFELNRFLFIWLTFLAAAAAVHRRLHFRLTLLGHALRPAVRVWLEAIADVAVVGLASVLLVQGAELTSRTFVQRSSAFLLPMGYVYSVIPLSAALTIGFIALRWLSALQEGRFPQPDEPGTEGPSPGQPPAAQAVEG